jgi:hypothetical protein
MRFSSAFCSGILASRPIYSGLLAPRFVRTMASSGPAAATKRVLVQIDAVSDIV